MQGGKTKQAFEIILREADIKINGKRPWDIQVHNPKFYSRVLASPPLGLGESYMDGWWDCKALDEFSCRLLRGRIDKQVKVTNPSFLMHVLI